MTSIETLSMPSRVVLNSSSVPKNPLFRSMAPRSDSVKQFGQMVGSTWSTSAIHRPYHTLMTIHFRHPRASKFLISINVCRPSLFLSAPIIVERQAPEGGMLLRAGTPEESVELKGLVSSHPTSTFCEPGLYVH